MFCFSQRPIANIFRSISKIHLTCNWSFGLYNSFGSFRSFVTSKEYFAYGKEIYYNHNMLKLTFLGTSSGVPTKERNVSAICLAFDSGETVLFDCGEGTQHQFYRSQNVKLSKLTSIFITHLHGDHCFGLPGLMCSVSMHDMPRKTIQIFGPIGLRKFLNTSLLMSDSHLNFEYQVFEIIPKDMKEEDLEKYKVELFECEKQGGYIYWDDKKKEYLLGKVIPGWTVRAAPILHRVFTLGYVLHEDNIPGSLNVEKLQQLGLKPGPIYGKLKAGIDVTLDDGTLVRAADVIGPERKGRKIVILGDTYDPSGIAHIAMDCDVIIHEATLDNGQEALCVEKGHSTPRMAASFAKKINAKQLILTHFSARFARLNKEEEDTRDSIAILGEQAKKVFDNVELAEDFKIFEIKRN